MYIDLDPRSWAKGLGNWTGGLFKAATAVQNSIRQIMTVKWSYAARRASTAYSELFHTSPRLDAVDIIATDCANAEYKIFRKVDKRKGKTEMEPVYDHPAYALLENPVPGRPDFDGFILRYLTEVYCELHGECFWLLVRDQGGKGQPRECYVVPTTWVISTPSVSQPQYLIMPLGNTSSASILANPEDVIWHKNPDAVQPYARGRGRTEAIGDQIETSEYADKWQKNFFLNDATPKTVLALPGADEASVKAFKASWNQEFRGVSNSNKTAMVGWEAKLLVLGTSPKEMDFSESLKQIANVCREHYQIPPEMFGILEHCLDDQTECLTGRGWIDQRDLLPTDLVATWNEEAGGLEYHVPNKILRFDHDGPMHFWNGRVDFACTPQHRMWTRHGRRRGQRDGWVFETSEEVSTWTSARWRVTGGGYEGETKEVILPSWRHGLSTRHLDGSTAPKWRPQPKLNQERILSADIMAPFLGYWLSEGWIDKDAPGAGNVFYSQNEDRFSSEMRIAMESLDLGKVTERVRVNHNGTRHIEFRLCHNGLRLWLKDRCGDSAFTKKLPAEVFEWPMTAQKTLLRTLIDGDGLRKQGKSKVTISYDSRSEALIDDVQRLCIQIGMSAHKAFTSQGMWHLNITDRVYQTIERYGKDGSKASWVSTEHYKGVVWCLEIENERFFTRRNGRVVCHGNSNRSTIDAARYLYATNVLLKRFKRRESVLTAQLLPMFGSDEFFLQFDNPVQEDREFEQKLYTEGFRIGNVETDEWRTAMGMKPLGGEAGKMRIMPAGFAIIAGAPPIVPAPKTPVVPLPSDEPLPTPEPKAKSFRVIRKKLTEEELEALWAKFDEIATQAELPFASSMKEVAKAQRAKFTALFDGYVGQGDDPEQALTKATVEIYGSEAVNATLFKKLAPAWAKAVREGFDIANDLLGGGVNWRLYNPALAKWVVSHGLDAAKEINGTTKEELLKLRPVIAEGLKNGWSMDDVARKLNAVYDKLGESRATLIARTETMSSINTGQFETYLGENVTRKKWLHYAGSRDFREVHAALGSSESIPIGQAFDVNGKKMMYPGADNGGAEENANCSCTIAPDFDDEE